MSADKKPESKKFIVALTMIERLRMRSIWPDKLKHEDSRVIFRISEMVKPTDKERARYSVTENAMTGGLESREDDGMRKFLKMERKFEFTPLAIKTIRHALNKMNREDRLTADYVTLFEKLMPAEELPEDNDVGKVIDEESEPPEAKANGELVAVGEEVSHE